MNTKEKYVSGNLERIHEPLPNYADVTNKVCILLLSRLWRIFIKSFKVYNNYLRKENLTR